MNDPIFLHGIALANFRGFGPDTVTIGPFERFNFMIGPNNSGKSGVLRYLSNQLKPVVGISGRQPSGSLPSLDPLEIHLGATRDTVRMGIGVPKMRILESVTSKSTGLARQDYRDFLAALLDQLNEGPLLWVERKPGEPNFSSAVFKGHFHALVDLAPIYVWNDVWELLTGHTGGDLVSHWIPQTFIHLLNATEITLPEVSLIPAIREISARGHEFKDWSGRGLIEELARLQNPRVHERKELEKFDRINRFLKSVCENETACIEIPHDREHVLVHMDGKVLPLESLGTGIHEVVMLASFCTLMDNQIVCIEEPEIHLHPLLQRRLVRYLQDKTTNQYFVATHSASVIDMPGAAVFGVNSREGKTQVETLISPTTRFDICRELGYKASDLLQANAIVWVEGPSDRIYLRHWIKAMAPELNEGLHYSIMFYGGRLLSHLSAEEFVADDEIEALIAIRKLNRNLAFIIDSDRASQDSEINGTKQRVQSELAAKGGLCWVTAGREIENYVPQRVISQVLGQLHGRFGKQIKTGIFDNVLKFRTIDGALKSDVDKVRVAKAVCALDANLDILDLREQVSSLVEFIRRANN